MLYSKDQKVRSKVAYRYARHPPGRVQKSLTFHIAAISEVFSKHMHIPYIVGSTVGAGACTVMSTMTPPLMSIDLCCREENGKKVRYLKKTGEVIPPLLPQKKSAE